MKLRYKAFVNIFCNVLIFVLLCSIILYSFGGKTVAVNSYNDAPYYFGDRKKPYVSLMINVYWGTEYITEMMDILDKYGFNCTFFVGGSWAAANAELMLDILSRGNELGNHGYYHKDMAKLNLNDNVTEIKNCNNIVLGLTGFKVTLFAPPSGSFSKQTLDAAERLDMKTIMWTRDTVDWRDKNREIIYKRAVKNLKGGDLILMHPTKETVAALDRICQTVTKEGYSCETVTKTLN